MAASPETQLNVLVIDDEKLHAQTVAEILERQGYHCTVATSGKEGSRKIDQQAFDLIITDLKMGDLDGLAILRKAREVQQEAEVMVVTGYGDVKTAVTALQEGASHYLLKPLDKNELLAVVAKSVENLSRNRALRDLRKQLDERFGFEGIIGSDPKMMDVINRLKAYAPTKATVLILGENGTGKELVAKALHTNSPRKNKPFVAMNCAALNENLLDDEMFGHEPGAFTGADKMRKGRFEHAHGGTLFLDEVGDMPLALQAKLLRVLENGEVSRIGSNELLKVDVRLIAATNRNLETLIADGKFRQDLYFRLKVGTLRLPPLRERRDDIPRLVPHFLNEFNSRYGKHVSELSKGVWKAFEHYSWPGNVRELRNQIESMIVVDSDGILGMDDLPDGDSLKGAAPVSSGSAGADALIGKPLREVERFYMEKALEITNGNREEASRMLGIGERTLYRSIRDWKIQDEIKAALENAGGNLDEAAKALKISRAELEKKLDKFKQQPEEE
ncbi:MAG: sigma 54-interacting transcriptional regulator [Planctomycetes bacterium]|nr:sigma 54-interacting transcriptional regulator [Planctomycetota bacterium]